MEDVENDISASKIDSKDTKLNDEDEKRELKTLSLSVSVNGDNLSESIRSAALALPRFQRPQKVVKRITRTITPKGEELIEVRILVSDAEVARVERKQALVAAAARQTRNSGAVGSARNRANAAKKPTAGVAEPVEEQDFDDYEDSAAVILKLRSNRNKVCD